MTSKNVINLMHGDCIERMKELPDMSIDMVLSDIPYGIGFSEWDVKHKNTNTAYLGSSPAQKNKSNFKRRGKPKNGWSKEDRNRPLEFQAFCKKFLLECNRLLKPAGTIICFTGRQYQHRFIIAAEEAGLVFKDTITWDKGGAPFRAQRVDKVLERRGIESNTSYRLGNLAPRTEPIVWLMKPYRIGGTITDCFLEYGTGCFSAEIYKTNIISHSSHIKNRVHETQKPLELIENLVITFSKEGHTVLDMFMGSGTTGLACINTNRSFIGIELDEDYFTIAQATCLKVGLSGSEWD